MKAKRLEQGEKFGRLTVVSYEGGGLWKCDCECGGQKVAKYNSIKSGMTKSCGCMLVEQGKKAGKAQKTHGMSGTRTHSTWKSMRNRCTNPNNAAYPWYGGRGIKVCERWQVFENFYQDMGERPEGASIDRIDSDGDYCPDNCKWSTHKEQYANRRNHNQHTTKTVI